MYFKLHIKLWSRYLTGSMVMSIKYPASDIKTAAWNESVTARKNFPQHFNRLSTGFTQSKSPLCGAISVMGFACLTPAMAKSSLTLRANL